MAVKKGKFTGKMKAAILMISLGPERSASLFSHMQQDEIEELTLEIASMQRITPEEKEQVLEEFYQLLLAKEFISEGGINYAKEVLEKAMGTHKALEIINKLTSSLQVKPFDFVKKTDANQLLSFIQNEHPQTLALILSYLNPTQAAQILSALPQGKQAEVAQRIAVMGSTSPEVIKEVEGILEKKLSTLVTQDYSLTGGIQSIVDILNAVDRGTEKYILETLEIQNAELVEEIRKKMFVFEDIIHLDGVAIQRFIREVDNSELAVALKTATEEVKDMIFANMSARMKEMLKEDMDFMGPVRLRDVEEAQQKIVNIIRKLEEANEIVIARGGGDELVV
ncbi:MAG: flagellar motor switch protein FliG [Bacillota bacterium]|nr:flagellar motor switch protein FliG [Bacillota bacterium]